MPSEPADAEQARVEGKPRPWSRRRNGDVHVTSMAGDVRPVPGSSTTNGKRAITAAARDVLERVRRSIRERAAR